MNMAAQTRSIALDRQITNRYGLLRQGLRLPDGRAARGTRKKELVRSGARVAAGDIVLDDAIDSRAKPIPIESSDSDGTGNLSSYVLVNFPSYTVTHCNPFPGDFPLSS